MAIVQRQMNSKSLENLTPGGKPWKKQRKKTLAVTARTSPEARKGWERLAQQHDLTLSELIERIGRGEFELVHRQAS